MKTFSYILSVVAVFTGVILLSTSCKKEVPPTLRIHVVDTNGVALPNAHVYCSYGPDANQGTHNEVAYNVEGKSGSSNIVEFNFPNSAILDVEVVVPKESFIPPNTYVMDTLRGKKVVKIELKFQRSSENVFDETVTVE